MNPPFSTGVKHVNHAFDIAPEGCTILALLNAESIRNPYTTERKRLAATLDQHGEQIKLENTFVDSEHSTQVDVAFIRLVKPKSLNDGDEFSGFFTEEDTEETQYNGLMSYNLVRDVVNRYVEAVKLFDKQLELGVQMNDLTKGYFFAEKDNIAMSVSQDGAPLQRERFKKEMQKSGWLWVFKRMNLEKYSTKGLRADINKFVERQSKIPFTMRNIYKMLEIVIGTTESRMDKALEEVFDKLTKHYNENRFGVEGWKTNDHYILNRRFIIPGCVTVGYSGQFTTSTYSSSSIELIEDMVKALCYISGDNYDDHMSLYTFIHNRYKLVDKQGKYVRDKRYEHRTFLTGNTLDSILVSQKTKDKAGYPVYPDTIVLDDNIAFGKWFDWGFFRVRGYKKGTLHFEFKDERLLDKFNQRISKIKGYPLYEHV